MNIYGKLDASETDKVIIKEINGQGDHITLLTKQIGDLLATINSLKKKINSFEKREKEERLRRMNQF